MHFMNEFTECHVWIIILAIVQLLNVRWILRELYKIQYQARIFWNGTNHSSDLILSVLTCTCSVEKHKLEQELDRIKKEIRVNELLLDAQIKESPKERMIRLAVEKEMKEKNDE